MMRNAILGAVAISLTAVAPILPASAAGCNGHYCPGGHGAFHGRGPAHFGGGRYAYGHGGGYGGGGNAVAAGVAGLAAGAIIGGAIASSENGYYAQPAPVYQGNSESYCASTYHSYDPASGTYLGYDGLRHPCP
jgi:BA14K-like protein